MVTDSLINLSWGLLFLIVNFSFVLLSYYLFGKIGVLVWIAIASIIANIQVTKTIDIFSLSCTLGNIFYGSIFLATDILTEKYGKKVANQSVLLGFFANIVMLIAMQMALFFIPKAGVDISQEALETIFGFMPLIVLGSLVAYVSSQFLDVYLFSYLKKKTKDKKLWLRNNLATALSQLVDTCIFVFIAFGFTYEIKVVLEILLTTYLLKLMVSLLDTPFIYIAKKITPGRIIPDDISKVS